MTIMIYPRIPAVIAVEQKDARMDRYQSSLELLEAGNPVNEIFLLEAIDAYNNIYNNLHIFNIDSIYEFSNGKWIANSTFQINLDTLKTYYRDLAEYFDTKALTEGKL